MPVNRLATALSAGGLAAALAITVVVTGNRDAGPPVSSLGRISPVALTSFTDCNALLAYYRGHAAQLIGPYGLPSQQGAIIAGMRSAAEGGVPAAVSAPMSAAGASGSTATGSAGADTTSSTGTNIQVAGVDEADLAKRSGDLLLSVGNAGSGGELRVTRLSGAKATVVGRLATPGWTARELLVSGSTVLLIGPQQGVMTLRAQAVPGPGESFAAMPFSYRPRTRIVQVDFVDPSKPRAVRTLDVSGTEAGARLVDGVARIAVTSAPQLPVVMPRSSDAPALQKATEVNRSLVGESTLDAWLPSYTLADGLAPVESRSTTPGSSTGGSSTPSGGTGSSGRLVDCTRVWMPKDFAGLDTLTLMTLDLHADAGISRWQAAGVVASGATVYATADHTYLATTQWQNWSSMTGAIAQRVALAQRTAIHEFATSGAQSPRYLASGSVPGFLLNQFAMDEFHGDLRVAATTRPTWLPQPVPAGGEAPSMVPRPSTTATSTSQVTVLRQDGEVLAPVGRVSGLGVGEQIRAVRFLGPVGYVVTYRQTDPLYTVDLSDPAHPRVAGELKLLGYSAYLHPVGDGLLLGVGQDADGDGRVRGLQLSLFDVSDPAAPRRVSQVRLPQGWSDIESDHHAFTFADGLVLVPFIGQVSMPMPDPGVVTVRLTGHTLGAPTVLRAYPGSRAAGDSPAGNAIPQRTFVDSTDIWTLTSTGVAVHDVARLGYQGFTAF